MKSQRFDGTNDKRQNIRHKKDHRREQCWILNHLIYLIITLINLTSIVYCIHGSLCSGSDTKYICMRNNNNNNNNTYLQSSSSRTHFEYLVLLFLWQLSKSFVNSHHYFGHFDWCDALNSEFLYLFQSGLMLPAFYYMYFNQRTIKMKWQTKTIRIV